ncbi:riboflavin kinase [Arthrobacter cavernae]|uniref:riboflavin kinase n=1 Tax=Arthrobacter cavernae TaxID=2817681 RepID=A0A939HDQ5_9MICC|nr:riboflavin kinase [Arthrobacter cavernae]MBO1267304.1 riboflavin kinase [Arthrobacter cavernae]
MPAIVEGTVEYGDQRGRTLGFPTANIPILGNPELDGVWAGLVETGLVPFAVAAVSIGRRRTFYSGEGERLLEAHLLDTEQELYGQHLRVHLLERLRPQAAFPSVEALIEQLHEDVEQTRRWAELNQPWLLSPIAGTSPAK